MESKKNFVVLLTLAQNRPEAVQAFMSRLAAVDRTKKVVWTSSSGAAVLASTPLSAEALAISLMPEDRPSAEKEVFRDMLILQLGRDHWVRSESAADGWLNSHQG